jgi:hypothetical protein
MSIHVRSATSDDLDAVVALAARRRAQLARWQPQYWNPAAEADALHRMWLDFLIQSDAPTRVVVEDDVPVAFAVSVDQGDQTFVDDLAVAPGRWPDAGELLLTSIPEQPAVICIPAGDEEAHDAADAAGVEWVSSYWLLRRDAADLGTGPTLTTSAEAPPEDLTAPPHTMKSANPAAPPMQLWEGGGVVVASPPVPAPPIYDPGGMTCVIDRVHGGDRGGLLQAAVRTSFARGDVGVVVVAGTDDAELLGVLARGGWRHVVDIGRLVPRRN